MRIAGAAACLGFAIAAGAPWPSSAAESEPTEKDLLGAWAGTMTHEGEVQPMGMELEPAEGGQVLLRLTLPAMHFARQPMGTVKPEVEGNGVKLGLFSFEYDDAAGTLSGTMPAGFVPVYQIPVTLRRVERVEVASRRSPTAPLATPAWTFDAAAPIWAGVSSAAGVVYAGDEEGRLHALDADTGERRWIFQAGGPIRTRATVADGVVFFQADDGFAYRLTARGEERWRVQVSAAPTERLALSDPKSRYDCFGSDVVLGEGRLLLGTHDGRLLALDPETGERQWEFQAGDSIVAAPSAGSGRVYFGSFDGHVYALDAATGRLLWKRDTRGAILSTPALAGDRVVVGNRAYDILALDTETGAVAWKNYLWFSWVESPAAVRDGVAFLGSSDAALALALDVQTGRRLWEADIFGWAWGQPAVTAKRVYLQTASLRGYNNDVHRGGVMALERETGHAVWRFAAEPPIEGAWGFPGSPAVGLRLVFVAGLDGRVLAFAQ